MTKKKTVDIKIRRLQIANYKGIDELELYFPRPKMSGDPDVVVMGSRNGLGKTSVLDSIWYALGGGKAMKGVTKPIRKGQDKAKVVIDLGELMVTRTWTKKMSALKVENKDLIVNGVLQ